MSYDVLAAMLQASVGTKQPQAFPVSASYAESKVGVQETNDKETEMLWFSVVKEIVAREAAVLKLRLVVHNLDTYYWEYALLRVKKEDRKRRRLLKEEQLVSKRLQIRQLQAEVSVAIAHARGASVAVVEAVVAWRAQLALSKSTTTVQTVSVFWEGKNYLEKVRAIFLVFPRR